jgi:hypothetical protein
MDSVAPASTENTVFETGTVIAGPEVAEIEPVAVHDTEWNVAVFAARAADTAWFVALFAAVDIETTTAPAVDID